MKQRTPEGYVKQAVEQLLQTLRIPYHRLNSGVVLAQSNGKTRAIRLAKNGTADILALARIGRLALAMPLYIETKAGKNGQSDAQRDFQAEVEAQGFGYVVARSGDDVLKWLKDSAL